MTDTSAPPVESTADALAQFLSSLDWSDLEKVESSYRDRAMAVQHGDALAACLDATVAQMASAELVRRSVITDRANNLLP
ncbi:hypothetical protein ACFQH9_17955 [Pseudonocardia lutea]|jgi:hypothetical protein|uniref:Uncharacterized protein n=1 Tax=Pseudonocardia lutea TaxID=2172015 RepID=A0ABW1ICS0_9PSEU